MINAVIANSGNPDANTTVVVGNSAVATGGTVVAPPGTTVVSPGNATVAVGSNAVSNGAIGGGNAIAVAGSATAVGGKTGENPFTKPNGGSFPFNSSNLSNQPPVVVTNNTITIPAGVKNPAPVTLPDGTTVPPPNPVAVANANGVSLNLNNVNALSNSNSTSSDIANSIRSNITKITNDINTANAIKSGVSSPSLPGVGNPGKVGGNSRPSKRQPRTKGP